MPPLPAFLRRCLNWLNPRFLRDRRVLLALLALAILYRLRRQGWFKRHHSVLQSDYPRAPRNYNVLPAFFPSRDGLWLWRRSWRTTAQKPRATLVLCHGFSEHALRYEVLARMLNRLNVDVYAFDLQGHGQSQGCRAFVSQFSDYADDLADFIALVRAEQAKQVNNNQEHEDGDAHEHEDAYDTEHIDVFDSLDHSRSDHNDLPPLFLFGHSMGGAIVTHALLRHAPGAPLAPSTNDPRLQKRNERATRALSQVKGVVLSSPFLGINEGLAPPIVQKFAKWIASVMPKFRMERLPLKYVSHDPCVVQRDAEDPLVIQGGPTLHWACTVMETLPLIQQHAHAFKWPLLVVAAGDDRIVDTPTTERFVDSVSSEDKCVRVIDGAFHEVLFETAAYRRQALQTLRNWLSERLK
ncbi:MAG: hypothetical protein MHM6MM_002782 [Cercozoa sp. M6MM]